MPLSPHEGSLTTGDVRIENGEGVTGIPSGSTLRCHGHGTVRLFKRTVSYPRDQIGEGTKRTLTSTQPSTRRAPVSGPAGASGARQPPTSSHAAILAAQTMFFGVRLACQTAKCSRAASPADLPQTLLRRFPANLSTEDVNTQRILAKSAPSSF